MFTKQKIKKLIIILSCMIIFSLSLVFYNNINSKIINIFADRFNIVSNKENMLVHFINVHQADAVAINLPDGKIMLIDSGSKDVNTTYINYLKENVLNTRRSDYIDYLVLSHSDMDHVGGTMKLLKNFQIGTIYMPKLPSNSNGYAEILNYVDKYQKYETLGLEFKIADNGYEFTFFESLNETNTNDSSQIVKLEYKDKSFLFSGDISSSVEQQYVEVYGEELNVDVLKVSHHGSKTATSAEFLEYVSPEYAVISVGAGNDYGHPTDEVLNRLNVVGAKILRTDCDGNVLFVVGENYNLKQLDGVYHIIGLPLDYSYYIFCIDLIFIVYAVIVVVKKKKKKNKHITKELLV